MNISQTIIKSMMPTDACGQMMKFRFVDKVEWLPSEVMKRGNVFEHHVLGETRNGDLPELKKLKGGGVAKAEQDLMELVTFAKSVLDEIKLDIKGGAKQLEIITDDGLEGHIDLITNDFQKPTRKAIYDLKYTETAYDDRWRGWADFDTKTDEKIQARHYILLYHKKFGEWIPYYFIVFGKAFWCRIIKVVVNAQTMAAHTYQIQLTREKIAKWEENGWLPLAEFNKCQACQYNSICKYVATVPEIEYFEI